LSRRADAPITAADHRRGARRPTRQAPARRIGLARRPVLLPRPGIGLDAGRRWRSDAVPASSGRKVPEGKYLLQLSRSTSPGRNDWNMQIGGGSLIAPS
jgi:hypothetical protein